MNDSISFVLGIAVRVFVASATQNNARVESVIVGLWEGIALYQLSGDDALSPAPLIFAAARFLLDWMVCRNTAKILLTILWGAVTRLGCEAFNTYDSKHERMREYEQSRPSSVERDLERQTARRSSRRQVSSDSSTTTMRNTPVLTPLSSSTITTITTTVTEPLTSSNLQTNSPPRSQVPFPSLEQTLASPLAPQTFPVLDTVSEKSMSSHSPSLSQVEFPPAEDNTPAIPSTPILQMAAPIPSRSTQPPRITIPNTAPVPARNASPSTPILPVQISPRSKAPDTEQIQPAPPLSVIIADETEYPIDQSFIDEGTGSAIVILSKQDEPSSPTVSHFHHSHHRNDSDDTLRTFSENSFVSSGLGGSDESESVVSISGKEALLNRAEIYRAQARDEFDKACKLKRERNQALRKKDTRRAFLLYLELKKCNEGIGLLNHKAARRIFMAHNQTHKEDTIDVHGLQREEAKFKTEQAIDAVIRAGRSRLNVIVGKGLHSANGVPILKRTIVEYLNEEYSQFGVQENPKNAGVLVVTFQV